MLLTRDEFRAAVLDRDGHKCVWCGYSPSGMGAAGRARLDAHHIMERRLFPDGGYYLDNGATLCSRTGYESCHLLAEQTLISPDSLRRRIGINRIVLPPHLYEDDTYDKWGNVILPNGVRLTGELFDDPSVQKVLLAGSEHPNWMPFTKRIKHPRMYHLPWSLGLTSDDRQMTDTSDLEGHELVVTVKMDGEQTTIYSDGFCHARSLDSSPHESRNWVKALAARVGPELPDGWRICGENLWAQHSLAYNDLPSYFLMFSLWDGLTCLSWQETEEWAALLGLHIVQRRLREDYSITRETSMSSDPQAALRARLLAIVEYKRAWQTDPSGQFERLAEQFYRETRLMAPGKSQPLEMWNVDNEQERQQAWDVFLKRLSDERDATIAEAAAALPLATATLRQTLELDGPEPAPIRVAGLLRQYANMIRRNEQWDVPETMAGTYESAALTLEQYQANADARLTALEAETQHDCGRWAAEGIGCAECNPAAIAARDLWRKDPVRKERDELRAEAVCLRAALTELEAAAALAPEAATDGRLACDDCALPYAEFPLDLVLPDEQWEAIHPAEAGVLCAQCIVRRASKVPGVTVVHARWDAPEGDLATLRCGRGHQTKQPKCPACHDLTRKVQSWLSTEGDRADIKYPCGCYRHYCATHRPTYLPAPPEES